MSSQIPLDEQYNQWFNSEDFSKYEKTEDHILREITIQELDHLSTMTVQEYTFHQKWHEIKRKFPVKKITKNLFGETCVTLDCETQMSEILRLKNNIWIPNSPDDYSKLEPCVELCDDAESTKNWNLLRIFIHSQVSNNNIGRNLRYFVKDRITNKYLGIFCISSDFMDLSVRDKHIGWSRDVKTSQKMINHLAIGSTIVAVQPLGYNFLGNKLIALMTLSDNVQNAWLEKYNDILIGMTTTSLYGTYSQYDNLKHWKNMGGTKGKTPWEPTWHIKRKLLDWLALNHPRVYWDYWHATKDDGQKLKRDHKFRSLYFIYDKLKIPKEKVLTEHVRGVYFSPFYNNGNEFLRKEIAKEDLIKKCDTSEQYFSSLWKEKYASKRIKNLIENERTRDEVLFYDDLISMKSFDEAKEKYLHKVGEGR
ncbi:DUF4338 domain-containing protein [bacterium]|jgi:hypothetical protein|nr:DUF4338 domain-containing protein [Candidatus Elulimicrobium humile]